MKRVMNYFARSFSSSKSAWSHLKNNTYTPYKDMNSIVLRDGELEVKYTKDANKIIKEVLHRHIDPVKQELYYPHSQIDEQAFNYFIKQGRQNTTFPLKHAFPQQSVRSFATLIYKEHKVEKELSIGPNMTVATSIGVKVISGLSMHKGIIQVNAFKDAENMLLARVQASQHDGVSTPFLRLGDKALLTHSELKMQYDLYCIEQDLYDQVILSASKLNSHVEAASHYTGMLKINKSGEVIFEYSVEGVERPKTEYNPNKGKFVSMESHEGNTAVLEHIAYKTQGPLNKYELVFIPKTHKFINQIIKVCEALLSIKNTTTQDPEVLDLVLKKHGLSNDEVAVELIREISKHDTSHGIFHVDIREFQEKNLAVKQFILEADFLDKNSSYKLQVSEETDLYNEPVIIACDQPYEEPIDFKVMGSSDTSDSSA